MKKYTILLVLAMSLILVSCKEKTQKEDIVNEKLTNKIEVIDFHSTHRCMTCNAIEANTKFTLDTYFSEELENKRITFQAINVDEESNFKIAEKYEATGTSLFLNIIVEGEETIIDLTNFAFLNGTDQQKFSDELKLKIEAELAKV